MPGFCPGYCPGFWKAGFLEIHLVTVISEKASVIHCGNAWFLAGLLHSFWKAGVIEIHLVMVTTAFEKASVAHCCSSNAGFLDGFLPWFLENLCALSAKHASNPQLVAVSHTDMLLLIAPHSYVSKIAKRKE